MNMRHCFVFDIPESTMRRLHCVWLAAFVVSSISVVNDTGICFIILLLLLLSNIIAEQRSTCLMHTLIVLTTRLMIHGT